MTITSLGVATGTQGTSAPTLNEAFTGVAVGDLSVVMLLCNSTQTADTINYSAGGSAGYTKLCDLSGTNGRVVIWYKFVVSGDLTSGEMKALTIATWAAVGTNAWVWQVLNGSVGWGTPVAGTGITNSQASTPWTIDTFTDPAVAAYGIYGISTASGGADLQAKWDDAAWDGTGSNDPTWPEATLSNSRQGGYKIAALGATGPARIMGHNQRTTNKAAIAALFPENAIVLGAGKGAAASSAKGTVLLSLLTVTGKGAAAASAKGSIEAVDFVISGKGAAAASAKAAMPVLLPYLTPGAKGASAATAIGAEPVIDTPILPTGKGAAAASAKGTVALDLQVTGKGAAAGSAKATVVLVHVLAGTGPAAGSAKGTSALTIPLAGKGPAASSAKGSILAAVTLAGKGAAASSAKGVAVVTVAPRNLTVIAGAPSGRWTATDPSGRWTPGAPSSRWAAAAAQD